MKSIFLFVLILIILNITLSISHKAGINFVGGMKTLPPIMIESKVTKSPNIPVGKILIINIGKNEIGKDGHNTILTCIENCSGIVEISQAKDDGMAQYNPSIKAIKVGTTKINVQLKSGCNYDVIVNVV
jgi:hypothetical protein